MKPTKTHGICGYCREANPYTQINCSRCGARLAWAFLIDGRKDADFDTPLDKFLARLLGRNEASPQAQAHCRFCDKGINFEAKICPHCGIWLVSAAVSRYVSPLVDPDAPEIRRLLKSHSKSTG